MKNLDLKDRKILYELDFNCRQTNTQIGKKVGLKKDIVSYRIRKLQQTGIIDNYYTVIDAFRLGYNLFRYYINFQYVLPQLREEIINYFINYRNIATVSHFSGKYDLILLIWVNNLNEFYRFWNKSLDKYGDYFERKIFSVYIHGVGFRKSYLMLEEFKKGDRIEHEYFGAGNKIVEIDKNDYYLINEISLNARIPLIELSNKLNCSSQTVNYRLNNLKKSGVIQAFRVGINETKLGLKRFKVDIYLKEHKQRDNIINYIKQIPYVLYISTSTGLCDLEIELILENSNKLTEILEEINVHFPNSIKKFNYYGDVKIYKETFLPKLLD